VGDAGAVSDVTVDVEYAHRGDISIAYQAIGDGPVDIIFVRGWFSHLDLVWADPYATAFLRELASIGAYLLFDKPGTGAVRPVAGIPTVHAGERTDFLAVLDAAGSKRAVVIGSQRRLPPAALLAADAPRARPRR